MELSLPNYVNDHGTPYLNCPYWNASIIGSIPYWLIIKIRAIKKPIPRQMRGMIVSRFSWFHPWIKKRKVLKHRIYCQTMKLIQSVLWLMCDRWSIIYNFANFLNKCRSRIITLKQAGFSNTWRPLKSWFIKKKTSLKCLQISFSCIFYPCIRIP